jgi:hypothetical protein
MGQGFARPAGRKATRGRAEMCRDGGPIERRALGSTDRVHRRARAPNARGRARRSTADETRQSASESVGAIGSQRGVVRTTGRDRRGSVNLRESFQIDVCSTLRQCARGRDILIGSAVASVVSVLVLGGTIVKLDHHSSLCPIAAYLMDLAMLPAARGVEWPTTSRSPPRWLVWRRLLCTAGQSPARLFLVAATASCRLREVSAFDGRGW